MFPLFCFVLYLRREFIQATSIRFKSPLKRTKNNEPSVLTMSFRFHFFRPPYIFLKEYCFESFSYLNESNDPHRSLYFEIAPSISRFELRAGTFSFSWPTFIIIRKRPLHIISPTFFNNFFILCLLTNKNVSLFWLMMMAKKKRSVAKVKLYVKVCDLNYYWPFRLDFIDTLFIYLYFGSALEDISIIAQNPFFQFNCVE